MKKLFLLVSVFSVLLSFGQYTTQPFNPSTESQSYAKPVSATGDRILDAKQQDRCQSCGVGGSPAQFPYRSLADVTTRLKGNGTAAQLQAHVGQIVDVNLTGTWANGSFNGTGKLEKYIYDAGLNLVPFTGIRYDTATSKIQYFINGAWKNIGEDELPKGAYNIEAGLARWRAARGIETALNAGGVDVVIAGDSRFESYNSPVITYGFRHILMKLLQKEFNPATVPGGAGFMPILEGAAYLATPTMPNGYNARYVDAVFSNRFATLDGDNSTTSELPVNGKRYALVGSDNYVTLQLNGTASDAADKRLFADKIQLVGIIRYNEGRTVIDIKEGSAPLRTQGTNTYYQNHGFNNLRVGGVRWGKTEGGGLTDAIDLNRNANNFIRLSAGTGLANQGGDANSPGAGYVDGFIAYDGDFTSGVRVHDLSYFGRTLQQQLPFLTCQNGTANYWGTGTKSGGSSNEKLFVTNFITNDAENVTLQTFLDNYTALIDYQLALPSKPSVLIVIEQKRNNANANWEAFRNGLKNLAISKGCAVFDINEFFGNGNYYGGMYEAAGWSVSDGVHESEKGQKEKADLLFKILKSGGSSSTVTGAEIIAANFSNDTLQIIDSKKTTSVRIPLAASIPPPFVVNDLSYNPATEVLTFQYNNNSYKQPFIPQAVKSSTLGYYVKNASRLAVGRVEPAAQLDVETADGDLLNLRNLNENQFSDIKFVNGSNNYFLGVGGTNSSSPNKLTYRVNGFVKWNLDVNGNTLQIGSHTYQNAAAVPAAPASGCTTFAINNHFYVICAGESSATIIH